jgi:hypothetical protein
VSIQESKALTGNIRPGRHAEDRRVVTSGALVAPVADGNRRDLPAVEKRKIFNHGVRASKVIKE